MNLNRYQFLTLVTVFLTSSLSAQINMPGGVSGNFQLDAQTYKPDSAIGAPDVPEKMLSNAFINILFTKGNFTAGVRFESYLNVLQGYDARYNKTGIMYRFAEYTKDNLTVTAGSFYEQFGSGLICRSYVEPGLGYDNFFDGVRVKYNLNGIYLKAFVARQRFYWEYSGLVRGFDGEANLNELFPALADKKTNIIIGGSFVSKYQKDQDPTLKLPENVGASAARINVHHGGFSFYGEYAYKINDPSLVNEFIYKNGEALYLTLGYTKKGLGINFSAKRIDNMNYRSDRNATQNNLNINYLPSITRNYTYRLLTLYPYATQPNGEMGASGEIYYSFKPDSKLGGKYGTTIGVNGSIIYNIEKTSTGDQKGYTSEFFGIGNPLFYQDAGISISKKISKDFKFNLDYYYIVYNQAVIEAHEDSGTVYSNSIIGEFTYKFNSKNSLRMEIQNLIAQRDRGNWTFILAEYAISPHWLFSVFDEYNYGKISSEEGANPAEGKYNYPNAQITYVNRTNRFSIGYAKQRSGLLCVGGVCRYVPAANGFTFSVTSSF